MRRTIGLIAALAVMAGLGPGQTAVGAEVWTPDIGVTLRHWPFSPRAHAWWDESGQVPEGTTYDVRLSRSSSLSTRRAPWTYPEGLQGTNVRDLRLPIGRGTVLCASVRMHLAGATGPWSVASCDLRGFDHRSVALRGDVRLVRHPRLWVDRGMVPHGRGRIIVRRVPAGARLGVVDAYAGGYRTYGFTCGRTRFSDGRVPGDEHFFNRMTGLVRRPIEPCTLRLVAGDPDPGFIIESIWVQPPWLS
jgi:hypothetical protein